MTTQTTDAAPAARTDHSAAHAPGARRTAGTTNRTTPAIRRASAVVSWAAVTAWGSGLIALALGAGAVTAGDGNDAARGAGVALIAAGVAALAWGAATLATGRVIAPHATVASALALGGAGVVALVTAPATTSPLALAAMWLLLVSVAILAAGRLRPRAAASTGPRVSALFIAAVVVAGLVTPALSATEAGHLAPDHGSHAVFDEPHH